MSRKDGKSTATPRLRFPEFRKATTWPVTKIGDVLEEVARPIEMDDDATYALVTVKRRYGGVIAREQLTGRTIKVKSQFIVTTDDFLISKRQIVHDACGVLPAELDGSIVSNEYSVLRARKNVDVRFFSYFAQQPSVSASFLASSVGIVIEKMLFKLKTWLRFEFPFPGLAEQQKIADCLTSLDEVIAAQGRKVAALSHHKRALMQDLFPREGETLPRLRFPEFRDGARWEQSTLASVGKMRAGTFVSASEIAETRDRDSFPCYGGNGLRGFTKSFTHSGKYVLIGRQGALCGNAFLVDEKFHATEHALVVTTASNTDAAWLYYVLGFLSLNQYSIGQAQPGLSVGLLEKIPVAIPPDAREQQRIAACLSALDAQIAAESEKARRAQDPQEGPDAATIPVADRRSTIID